MQSRNNKIGITAFIVAVLIANQDANAGTSVSVPVTDLKYAETGIGPINVAAGFGDMNKGAHSNFVKIPGGFNSPLHVHSEDYYAVVVSGVIGNGTEGAQDIPLAPGSYWFQKGNEKHVTKCLSATECVFFVTQPGKFDFVISK